ncbi:MAG TPA: prepilin-type N-terminal cleavage/methylation domain-containing protein [Geobacteraceae bacterium]
MGTLSFQASGTLAQRVDRECVPKAPAGGRVSTADRPRNSFAKASGFTLLEVMIALAIMAGVILTVISSFNFHLSVVNRDREETIAVLLGRAKLDDPLFNAKTPGKGTFAPDWPGFSWQTVVEPAQIPGAAGLLNQLTLTVSWDGERRKVSLVEYLPAQ